MRSLARPAIFVLALLLMGAVRLPFEIRLRGDLEAAGLLDKPLAIGTREKIGQTSSAVALGGLRTLVATFLNLRAFGFFAEQRWADVESSFETIVDLAPRTRYYWETGAWHLGYNAASYYQHQSDLPALRRNAEWRAAILKARTFLERGIRNNPNDWSLYANLGFLLSDANKFAAFGDPDATFAAAADAYGKAAATGNSLAYVRRSQLYALARAKGHEAEALALARQLYGEGQANRTPTLLALLLVLEKIENPSLDTAERAVQLFGSEQKAYDVLSNHWLRTHQRFPVDGVAEALRILESRLGIPAQRSVFSQSAPPPQQGNFFQN